MLIQPVRQNRCIFLVTLFPQQNQAVINNTAVVVVLVIDIVNR